MGTGWTFRITYRLRQEIHWLQRLGRQDQSSPPHHSNLLKPLIHVLEAPHTCPSVPNLLDSIETRLEDLRDISRYFIGILVFLGLLGTFWGLSQTITAIAKVISGITLLGNNVQEAFQAIISGLQSPLAGMGTAFSSSMFGLVGSMIVGFFDLQNSRLIRRFMYFIEEKLGDCGLNTSQNLTLGERYGSAYMLSLQEKNVHQLEQVCNLLQACEDNRLSLVHGLQQFTTKLQEQSQNISQTQQLHQQLGQYQFETNEGINRLLSYNASRQGESLIDCLNRLEMIAQHLLDESIQGRQQIIEDLRGEIRLVTRTLSMLGEPTSLS